MEQRLPSWKKGFWVSLIVGIVSGLIIFLFTLNEHTLESLGKIKPIYLFTAIIMVIFLWIIEGLRIRSILYVLDGKLLLLREAIRVFLFTFFFASVTPFAIGEWPAHVYVLNRNGISIGKSTAAAITRSFLTKLTFTIIVIIFWIAFRGQFATYIYNEIFKFAFIAIGAQALLCLMFLRKPEFVRSLIESFSRIDFIHRLSAGKLSVKRIINYIFIEIDNFENSTDVFGRRGPTAIIIPIFFTFLFWLFYFSIAPVLLLGLGINPPYFNTIIWQIMIFMVISYIPVPGGSGVVELTLASLFAVFVPSHVLGIYVAVWRLLTYYVILLCGGVVVSGKMRIK